MNLYPRTPADAEAEAKSAHAFYQRELDYFAIGRTPPLDPLLRRDVAVKAAMVFEWFDGRRPEAVRWALEQAEQSTPGEKVDTGELAEYFWWLVSRTIDSGLR